MSTYISEQSEWMEKWKNFELDEFKCKCGCEPSKNKFRHARPNTRGKR